MRGIRTKQAKMGFAVFYHGNLATKKKVDRAVTMPVKGLISFMTEYSIS